MQHDFPDSERVRQVHWRLEAAFSWSALLQVAAVSGEKIVWTWVVIDTQPECCSRHDVGRRAGKLRRCNVTRESARDD